MGIESSKSMKSEISSQARLYSVDLLRGLSLAFVIIRAANIYGDPRP